MYDFNYSQKTRIGRVCLEMSLKPFKEFDETSIEAVCRKLFLDWQKLTDRSDSVAVMLWTADGSEILEYTGDLSQTFDYCDLIGIGNPTKKPPYDDGEKNNLHVRPVPYNGERKKIDYAVLARIVAALKRIGAQVTGKTIRVIETFDPGPEFANSDFKYRRHTEICRSAVFGAKRWVHCASTLHAEDHAYAAYPDGIPEGTPFGEFLGRQLAALCRDVGFDGIWLSNGFGFSLSSWSWLGEGFDGERFNTDGFENVRDSILAFWKSFTAETGDMLIETRGSNLSAAMDIAAHGCPIDDIYSYRMLTPPNSPWAALDSRFGLELCGYLSHIAETSESGFLFRYYTHDPWWHNSPWFDRYGRSPHDIYLPLALARLDGEGKVTHPYGINFLSADDSFGQMPEKCPNEVIPHVLEGFDTYPDAPGLVTWLYPFADYCQKGLREGKGPQILMDDWYIESAIENGFPLSGVISDKNFLSCDPAVFSGTVLCAPVPFAGGVLETCVLKAVEHGIPLILYGSTEKASRTVRELIGVALEDGIAGELTVRQTVCRDSYTDGEVADRFEHVPLVSDGAILETAKDPDAVFATVVSTDGTKRAYGVYNAARKLVWLRGSFPHLAKNQGLLPQLLPAETSFPTASLLRASLVFFGVDLAYTAMKPSDKLPLTLFSRHDGAWYMTSFAKDTTVQCRMAFPQGVPMPVGTDCVIENGVGLFPVSGWCHSECRIFVRQNARSKLSCRRTTAGDSMMADHRMGISGLVNADVRFYPPKDCVVYATSRRSHNDTFDTPDETFPDGSVLFKNRSNELYLSWQDKETERRYRATGVIL